MATRIQALIIDPQTDFCDGPANGALPVPGAWADMQRLAAMIDRLGHKIDDINVTLDSHHTVDIAHPAWWVDSNGRNPQPFTLITSADIAAGVWTTRNPAWRQRSLDYTKALEATGKYLLFIWPEHCLIGSLGHAVQADLFGALRRWESREFAVVNYVPKGSNPFTEHYSAVAAEVPDPQDPTTMLNAALIDSLRNSDIILIAGEALSHCVRATVTDIANNIGEEHIRKFVLLEDATSSVAAVPGGPDFPAIGRAFVEDMKKRGMQVSTTVDFLRS